MNYQVWIEKAKAYNQSLQRIKLTPLQKKYVNTVDSNEGYYLVFDYREIVDLIPDRVDTFLDNQYEFRALLKTQSQYLCTYIKEVPSFAYTKGYTRISARTCHLKDHAMQLVEDIAAFYITDACGLDIKSMIQGAYDHEFRYSFAPVMAAAFLQEDQESIAAAKEVLTSENNVGVLTRDLICAIAMSHNEELQDLLLSVVSAARLQEGLRQSVAEVCDAYQLSFLNKMISLIMKENLIRYASIQRAIMTWCGIGYEEVTTRQIGYLLEHIHLYIQDEASRKHALLSDQPLDIYLALFVNGIKNKEDAIKEGITLFERGQSHITASVIVYLINIQNFSSADYLYLFKEYEHDKWILALLYDQLNFAIYQYSPFQNTREAYAFAKRMEAFIHNMKAQETYHCKGFEWFYLRISKNHIAHALYDLYHLHKECPEILELFLPYAVGSLYGDQLKDMVKYDLSMVSRSAQSKYLLKNITAANETLQEAVKNRFLQLDLTEDEILQLEEKLKTKRGNARGRIVEILANQKTSVVQASYERLSSDAMLTRQDAAKELADKVPGLAKVQSKDIKEVTYSMKDGLGLYHQDQIIPCEVKENIPTCEIRSALFHKKIVPDLSSVFVWNEQKLFDYFEVWSKRIEKHGELEYQRYGEYYQINNVHGIYKDWSKNGMDAMPFPEIWRDYFQQDALSMEQLFVLVSQLNAPYANEDVSLTKVFSHAQGIVDVAKRLEKIPYYKTITELIEAYYEDIKEEARKIFFHQSKIVLTALLQDAKIDSYKQKESYTNTTYSVSLLSHYQLKFMLSILENEWENEEEFKSICPLILQLFDRFTRQTDIEITNKYIPSPLFLAKAVKEGFVSKELLYEGILCIYSKEKIHGYYGESNELNNAIRLTYQGYAYNRPKRFNGILNKKYQDVQSILVECLDEITDRIIQSECTRINQKTDVSDFVHSLDVVFGLSRLIKLIQAMEHENFVRHTRGNEKRDHLTWFIRHCWPLDSDCADMFHDTGIKEERLVEVAMLAPQWISLISEYLKWDGFIQGCYYFIAHMKEGANEAKKAEIAKYTSLDPIDLQDGAFDMEWCRQVYKRLGKKRFQVLYQASKFLCDNACHTRARKYADACLGFSKKEDLLKQAQEKRNKDALNAYCIVPLTDEQDLLERYQNVQTFLTQSKQFGSQRQASEKRCVQIALINLARNSGYGDATRLTWMMESKIIESTKQYLIPQKVDDYEAWIEILSDGKNKLRISKNGKLLNSVPAKIKKHEVILTMKEIHQDFNKQQQRSKALLESAMEEQTCFHKEEIEVLMHHPILSPLLSSLVLKQATGFGFYKDGLLWDTHQYHELKDQIQIAHPYDLYQAGSWQDFQQYIFMQQIVQPFKQVFRELYLKLDEEKDVSMSKRYSGYQIQVKKAAAALKSRKWNLSYETGIQRILYHKDIIVNLYAEADWFSPSDIEAPCIDYVEFIHRKTGKSVLIKDIDDITYSEIMRDLDMAVSVAYVGGVDPLTTTSTIELRAAIITYTMELMRLDNVTIQDHFANIKGSLNDYSVHLGSGMIHQKHGANIHILPVHSQRRGKQYLPFLDEDPKMAEILSKIILLAEDQKLKDPTILSQIYHI